MFSTQRKGLVTVHMKFQGMFFSASFSLRCSFGCTHLDPGSTLNQVLTGFGFDIDDMECNSTNTTFEYQTMKTINLLWSVRFDCVVICASVFEMVYTCLRSQTFPGLFVQNPSQAFLRNSYHFLRNGHRFWIVKENYLSIFQKDSKTS